MSSIKRFDLSDAFLFSYLYQLETNLNQSSSLLDIKFQSEESNTDEYLKNFFKNYIKNNNQLDRINYQTLVFNYLNEKCEFKSIEILNCKILNVFKPDELSSQLKFQLKSNKIGVYTNPDLLLEIAVSNNRVFKSIELKSTKKDEIPGSSVQQVSPFEWVIFLKRDKGKIQISTGLYIDSINNKLPFPDRSPRPKISFSNLKNHNKFNRVSKNNIMTFSSDSDSLREKIGLISDWRESLINEWLETVLNKSKLKNEKWFNNVIRRYSYQFIEKYESLTVEEKKILLKKLKEIS